MLPPELDVNPEIQRRAYNRMKVILDNRITRTGRIVKPTRLNDYVLNHVVENSWLVSPIRTQEVEEVWAGQQFDFEKLKIGFKQMCRDFNNIPKSSNEKMYQFYFAMKMLFTVGPESKKVKKGNVDKTWKFSFLYSVTKGYEEVRKWIEDKIAFGAQHEAKAAKISAIEANIHVEKCMAVSTFKST